MTKPRLTYFDQASSRGEECRLALTLAGVDFEDNRLARSAWPAIKPTTPFGSLPVFEIPGKPAVSQSNAILGYVGRTYGLLPADPWEALRLESLMSAAEDLRHTISRTFGIEDADELARRRATLVETAIRPWGAFMEKQITGPFAGGEAISVADVKLFIMVGWLKKGVLDHVPPDVLAPFERLERVFQGVKSHPKIVEWYARPR